MSLECIVRLLCMRGTSSNSELPQFLLSPGQSAPGPLYWDIFHSDLRLGGLSTGDRTLLFSWWRSPFDMGVPLSAPLTLQLLREHPNLFANIAPAFSSIIFLICQFPRDVTKERGTSNQSPFCDKQDAPLFWLLCLLTSLLLISYSWSLLSFIACAQQKLLKFYFSLGKSIIFSVFLLTPKFLFLL